MNASSLSSVLAGVVVGVVAISGGCTANALCAKVAQCEDEENDTELEADSTAVCVEDYNGRIAALQANEEEECQRLASAQLALDACRAGLKCDDFFEGDLGGECDDQLDELEDALEDIDGAECTAQES